MSGLDIDKDKEYEIATRKELTSCLTAAVVGVLREKPEDPIEYIAHYLYKLRNIDPRTRQSEANHSYKQSEDTVPGPPNDLFSEEEKTQSFPKETQESTSCVPEEELTSNKTQRTCAEAVPSTNGQQSSFVEYSSPAVMVHTDTLENFNDIGDIFNDDIT